MKIFKIWQEVNNNYETYDSAVVIAEDEAEAKRFHPNGTYSYAKESIECDSWAEKEFVKVREIGTTKHNCEKGVIVASFNAG